MFNFTPLLGAQSASPASQSLLEFDGGIKILIDVGWDENFDVEKLREIEKYVRPCFANWPWMTLSASLKASDRCFGRCILP
jgi:Cft2 family RNA processing exonuclease